MADRYQLRADFLGEWIDVSKEDYIKAERQAGFRPKLPSDHPDYMKKCATGGFGGFGISGRILPAGNVKAESE